MLLRFFNTAAGTRVFRLNSEATKNTRARALHGVSEQLALSATAQL